MISKEPICLTANAPALKRPGRSPYQPCSHGHPGQGGPLKRTHLLVRAEQGVGNQIIFMSVIPDLLIRVEAEEGSIISECEPRLVP